jgi:DNA replication factor GINS
VFEFRFGKLMDMALRTAQGARSETTRLTIEEQEVYDKVYSLLKDCRSVVLEGNRQRIAEAEEPSLTPMAAPEMVIEAMREEDVATTPVAMPEVAEVRTMPLAPATQPAEEAQAPAAEPLPEPDHLVLRIIEDIPAFAGPGRTYRLQKEDLVSLPQAIARALIIRKKAVGVQMSR